MITHQVAQSKYMHSSSYDICCVFLVNLKVFLDQHLISGTKKGHLELMLL